MEILALCVVQSQQSAKCHTPEEELLGRSKEEMFMFGVGNRVESSDADNFANTAPASIIGI